MALNNKIPKLRYQDDNADSHTALTITNVVWRNPAILASINSQRWSVRKMSISWEKISKHNGKYKIENEQKEKRFQFKNWKYLVIAII